MNKKTPYADTDRAFFVIDTTDIERVIADLDGLLAQQNIDLQCLVPMQSADYL